MKYFILIIVFLFSLGTHTFSQQKIIDSLHYALKKAKRTAVKTSIYNQISYEIFTEYPDSGFYYADLAYKTALKLNDKINCAEALYNKGLTFHQLQNFDSARTYYHRAIRLMENLKDSISVALFSTSLSQTFKMTSNFDSSLFYAQKALKIYQSFGNKNKISRLYLLIGENYRCKGIYDKSIDYQMKALKIKEEINDTLGRAQCLGNLAVNYYDQGNLEKTIFYTEKCIPLFEKIQDIEGLATSYNLMAGIMMAKQLPLEAEKYFLKTLPVYEKLNYVTGIASVHSNLAIIYEDFNQQDKAFEHFNKAITISHNAGDQLSEVIAMTNLASFYNKNHKYIESIKTIKDVIKIAEKIEALDEQRLAYEILASSYYKINDFKNAFDALKMNTLLKDSIMNIEKLKQINELQISYETEKKETKINLLNKENQIKEYEVIAKDKELRSHRILIVFIIIASVILIVFLIIVFRLYRQKTKINNTLAIQNIEIRQQKEELLLKSNLLSNTVYELQKKNGLITESINYAKTIQTAIFPSEAFFEKHFSDFFIFFKPRDIVSGDFYWTSEMEKDIYIALSDCTGHGVPGAFMSMIGNTLLNQIVNEKKINNPANILKKLNEDVVFALEQHGNNDSTGNDGMDVTICKIDKEKKEITIASANQTFIVFADNNSPEICEGNIHVIGKEFGLSTEKDFHNQVFNYVESLHIYMFSDGFCDQFGGINNKRFGKEQTINMIINIKNMPLKEQYKHINNTFNDWKSAGKQTDDVTMIGIKI